MNDDKRRVIITVTILIMISIIITGQHIGDINILVNITPEDLQFMKETGPRNSDLQPLLLLLPLGALITAVAKNIIGINTFGTFAPSLIALSFMGASPLIAAALFISLGIVGLIARLALEKLQIMSVSRLGIMLTILVFSYLKILSFVQEWTGSYDMEGALLPMVVFTTVVENFFIMCEEDGFPDALVSFGGTISVVLVSMFVFRLHLVKAGFLLFPELVLLTAALLLLIGRYSGYRLTELVRFASFRRGSLPEGV